MAAIVKRGTRSAPKFLPPVMRSGFIAADGPKSATQSCVQIGARFSLFSDSVASAVRDRRRSAELGGIANPAQTTRRTRAYSRAGPELNVNARSYSASLRPPRRPSLDSRERLCLCSACPQAASGRVREPAFVGSLGRPCPSAANEGWLAQCISAQPFTRRSGAVRAGTGWPSDDSVRAVRRAP
jgi:hypothetical protein